MLFEFWLNGTYEQQQHFFCNITHNPDHLRTVSLSFNCNEYHYLFAWII